MATEVETLISRLSGTLYIAGEHRRSSGALHDVIDPATDAVVGRFADATDDDVDQAVAAANVAQREWWAMSALDRAVALHDVADRLLAM